MIDYKLLVLDTVSGNIVGELERTRILEVQEETPWGHLKFDMDPKDPKATWVYKHEIVREMQCWRNGKLIFWGPILVVRIPRKGKRMHVTAVGTEWYYNHQFIGPPVETFGQNMDFDAGTISPWQPIGVAAAINAQRRVEGSSSLHVVAGAPDLDGYVRQTYQETHSGTPGTATPHFLAAWVWIDVFTASALKERGLYVNVTDVATNQVVEERWEPISRSTPTGEWVRLETTFLMPLTGTHRVEYRLYGCEGSVFWDRIRDRVVTFVGSSEVVDFSTIIRNLLNYITPRIGVPINVSVSDTGQTGSRAFFEHDNTNALSILNDFVETGVAEYWIGWNAEGTQRTMYAAASRGQVLQTPVLDSGKNLDDFSVTRDGSSVASAVRFLGRGEGVNKETVRKIDTSSTNGILLERIETLAHDFPLDSMDRAATEFLACTKHIPVEFELEGNANLLYERVHMGDTVPVYLDYGCVKEDTTRRIVSRTLIPKSEIVRLGV